MNEPTSPNIDREKLEAILSNAVDSIITIDESGIVESVNPATESMFGYDADEIVGHNIKLLMPSPYRESHDSYLANYLNSGKKKIIGIGREVLGQRKDGSTFPIHLAVSEIRVGGKRFFTGMVRDISELKESERLAAIGQMMTGLAHESRNAFQKSHACLTNLAYDVRELPESLELVHKVQHALDDLNELLDEVRNYAAPIILRKTDTHIESAIREIWSQLIMANPDSGQIEFSVHSTSETPEHLNVDRLRIGQVFWNLLENARFATGESKGQVEVNIETDPSGKMVVVSVSDTGPGIRPEQLDSIFQPFFTTKTKGTGLGLAICQRIVESHGGSLSVENQSAGGARFTVTLPVT